MRMSEDFSATAEAIATAATPTEEEKVEEKPSTKGPKRTETKRKDGRTPNIQVDDDAPASKKPVESQPQAQEQAQAQAPQQPLESKAVGRTRTATLESGRTRTATNSSSGSGRSAATSSANSYGVSPPRTLYSHSNTSISLSTVNQPRETFEAGVQTENPFESWCFSEYSGDWTVNVLQRSLPGDFVVSCRCGCRVSSSHVTG